MKKQKTVEFTPYYDNMLILKVGGEAKTPGGIIVVNDDTTKNYSEGIVLKIGDGYRLQDGTLRPLKAQVGDTIYFRKMTEISMFIDGIEYFIVSEGNVLGGKEWKSKKSKQKELN